MARGSRLRSGPDLNRDGLQDPDEPGLEGVEVELRNGFSQTVASTFTDADGSFLFSQIDPGDYSLAFGTVNFFDEFTTMNAGDDLLDSDAEMYGETETFTLTAGETDLSWDTGVLRQNLGDRVWLDFDTDGIQDGAEAGVMGVQLFLTAEDSTFSASTTTGFFGHYGFAGVPPGRYRLRIQLPANHQLTAQNQGTDDTVDSDADPIFLTTDLFDVVEGQADSSLDFGLVRNGSVGDRIWLDGDGDGLQDVGENGVANVTVELFDEIGVPSGTALTNESGEYNISGIGPGDVFTTPDAGGDDLADSDVDPATGRTALFPHVAGTANRSHDAGLLQIPIFADGFESGGTSAWSSP